MPCENYILSTLIVYRWSVSKGGGRHCFSVQFMSVCVFVYNGECVCARGGYDRGVCVC